MAMNSDKIQSDIVTDNNNAISDANQQSQERQLGISSSPDKVNSLKPNKIASEYSNQIIANTLGITYFSDELNDPNLNPSLVSDSVLQNASQPLNPTPNMYTNLTGGAYITKTSGGLLGSGIIPIVFDLKKVGTVAGGFTNITLSYKHGIKNNFYEVKGRVKDLSTGLYYSLPYSYNNGHGVLSSFKGIFSTYDNKNINITFSNMFVLKTQVQIELYFLDFYN